MLVLVAMLGGVVSFFSPCVWPLYPAYIGQLAGTVGEQGPRSEPRRVLGDAAIFAAGFTIIFVAFGVGASALGQWLSAWSQPFRTLGGLVIIFFGLGMAGLLPSWLLGQPVGVRWRPTRPGAWGSLGLGMAFAFGWTPCVGPVLASILVLAGAKAHLGAGLGLLFAYSLGFALPFLGLAGVVGSGRRVLGWVTPALPVIERAGGVLLVALGLLVLTGRLDALSIYLYSRI